MFKKTPSSLDYETLLHELALKNWRRSLLSLDFARALANADQLARSTDRFWRWQGRLDVATTHLARGKSENALAALESARSVFPEVSPLQAPVVETEVHILVETGRFQETIAKTEPDTELVRYHRALAFIRLCRLAEAERMADDSAVGALVSLARGPAEEAIGALRVALDALTPPVAPGLRIPLLFLLGEALVQARELEEALTTLDSLQAVPDALLHWPIPYVRTHFQRAWVRHELGDRTGAKEEAETFLRFFRDGDMDRERLERADQLVKA